MDSMAAVFTPFINKIEKEIIVKASNHVTSDKSDFSALDYITGPTYINISLIYSYVVPLEEFERALVKTLNRFPEVAGHFAFDTSHNSHFKLVNNGCHLVLLERATISLEEMKATNFNYGQMVSNFCVDMTLLDVKYMLHVTVQYLKDDSGMVVHFAFNHLLSDATGYYIIAEDICSNIKNKHNIEAHSSCDESVHGQRTKYSMPSGREPSFQHSELTSEGLSAEFKQKLIKLKIKQMQQNPPKTVRLSLTEESMQKLKEYVYKSREQQSETSNPYIPSSNDCLVGVLWKAYAKTQTEDSSKNPNILSTIQVACNCRPRRKPAIPKNFFGNYSLTPMRTTETETLLAESDFKTACRIREMVSSVDENFIQSSIDFIKKNERAQRKWDAPNPFIVTNWNGMFDWFQGTDMGKGKPDKIMFLSKTMATFCNVLQGSSNMNDIDITLGGSPNHMEKFVQNDIIRKYFIIN